MTAKRLTLVLAATAVLAGAGCSSGSESDGPSTTVTSTPTATTVEHSGFPDPTVLDLQQALDLAGYSPGAHDGLLGPSTTQAIAAFQSANGLDATGSMDHETIFALEAVSDATDHLVVDSVQAALAALGFYAGQIDGQWGPESEEALLAFQADVGIPTTGQFTDATYEALVSRYDVEVRLGHLESARSLGIGGAEDITPPAPTTMTDEGSYLRQGDAGDEVAEIQRTLLSLGYRPGPTDGTFGPETASALLAFQKAEGLERDAIVGDEVRSRIASPQAAGPKSTDPGPRVEVDLDRQIMFVIDAAGNVATINVSTGSGKQYQSAEAGKGIVVAHTPIGEFTVQRSIDGNREAPLGTLYRPLYFDGGWAIHGNPYVPAYPASHGCVRTANVDQDFVFGVIDIGDPVSIYGHNPPPPDNAAAGF